MGFYLDELPDGTPMTPLGKLEALLALDGVEVAGLPLQHVKGDSVAVCVINNGVFEAAGIAFSKQELLDFVEGLQEREHLWLWVPITHVTKMQPYVEIEGRCKCGARLFTDTACARCDKS